MDFTLKTYQKLLSTLLTRDFSFCTFSEFICDQNRNVIILRQDVDKLPANSLKFAEIQSGLGIRTTYYFRIVRGSFDPDIICKAANLGHEIGYHYEDLNIAEQKLRAQGTGHRVQGDELERRIVEVGIESFRQNLEKLRKVVPVSTICMHGSPMSRWDSRLLWKYYDYKAFGLTGEPYFDIDFREVQYLTDTGRRWDGDAFSIRDRAEGSSHKSGHNFHSTFDIIRAAEEKKLPDKIMMTFHPQRWTDEPLPWIKELVWQNIKNPIKYLIST
jgi:hypothetical protein